MTYGACKSAFLVPEEFAFAKRYRDGRAIHTDEWHRSALTHFVNRMSHEFLPSPCSTVMKTVVGDPANCELHFTDGRTFTHNLAGPVRSLHFVPRLSGFPFQFSQPIRRRQLLLHIAQNYTVRVVTPEFAGGDTSFCRKTRSI